MIYSEEQLVNLAKFNTEELVRILTNPGENHNTLTLGADILATEVKDEQVVLPVLKKLLKHINALVREGAVIGVNSFYSDKNAPQEILDRLAQISKSDPSSNLRSFAKDSLEKYNL